MIIKIKTIIFLCVLFIVVPAFVHAARHQLGVELAEYFITQTHYFDQYENSFGYDNTSNLIRVSPELLLDPESGVFGYLRGDVTWEHYFQGDADRSYIRGEDTDGDFDAEFTDAFLGLKLNRFNAKLGLQPMQYGNGYIFADNALGAIAGVEINNFYLEVSGAKVFDSSPIIGIAAGYRFGLFENIDVFVVWFDDQDDAFKETLTDLIPDTTPDIISNGLAQNKGRLNWTGVTANKFLGKFYFTVVGAFEQGQVEFIHTNGKISRDISAYFFDIGMETNITDRLGLGLFCFSASGDGQPRGDLSAFISPLPYNPRASIFFDPNFMDRDETRTLIFGGVKRFGVISPGIHLTFEPTATLFVETQMITFYTQEAPSERETWYGWEIDLTVEYGIRENLTLFLNAARFEHGDFFKQEFGEKPDPAFGLLIGGQINFNFD